MTGTPSTRDEASDPIDEYIRDAIKRGTTYPCRDPYAPRLSQIVITGGEAASLAQSGYHVRLDTLGRQCTYWLVHDLGMSREDVVTAVEAEYRRAHDKHDGRTPYSDQVTYAMREAILLEEIGEVARACTPDAHTETGHAGDIADELIQTITMAAAWSAYITRITEGIK